jgi:hypothetical protein
MFLFQIKISRYCIVEVSMYIHVYVVVGTKRERGLKWNQLCMYVGSIVRSVASKYIWGLIFLLFWPGD